MSKDLLGGLKSRHKLPAFIQAHRGSGTKLAVAAALSLGIAACGSSAGGSGGSAGSGSPIKICDIDGYTGADAATGLWHSTQVAEQIMNEHGGVKSLGSKLIMSHYDTQSDPAQAATQAQAAISDGCKALLSPVNSAETLRIEPIAERAGIPLIIPGNESPVVSSSGYHVVFKLNFGAEEVAPFQLKAIKFFCTKIKADPCTLAFPYVSNSYGTAIAAAVKKDAPAAGIKLVGSFSYAQGQTDMSGIALKIKQAHPVAVWDNGYDAAAIELAKSLHSIGATPKIVDDAGYDLVTAGQLGSAINFGIGQAWWSPDLKFDNANAESQQEAFVKKFTSEYGPSGLTVITGAAGMNYTAIQILTMAMNDCKCDSGSALLHSLGAITMDRNAPAPFALILPQEKFAFGPYKPAGQVSQQNKYSEQLLNQLQGEDLVPVYPEGLGGTFDSTPWGSE